MIQDYLAQNFHSSTRNELGQTVPATVTEQTADVLIHESQARQHTSVTRDDNNQTVKVVPGP